MAARKRVAVSVLLLVIVLTLLGCSTQAVLDPNAPLPNGRVLSGRVVQTAGMVFTKDGQDVSAPQIVKVDVGSEVVDAVTDQNPSVGDEVTVSEGLNGRWFVTALGAPSVDAAPSATETGNVSNPVASIATSTQSAKEVRVPKVIGMSIAQAASTLAAVGLDYGLKGREPYGRILAQSPKPGKLARPGSPVLLTPKEMRPTSTSVPALNDAQVGQVVFLKVVRSTTSLGRGGAMGPGSLVDVISAQLSTVGDTGEISVWIWTPNGFTPGKVRFGDVVSLRVDHVRESYPTKLDCTLMDVWR